MIMHVRYDNTLTPSGYLQDAIGRLSSYSSVERYNRNQQQQLQLLDMRADTWQQFNVRFLALKQSAENIQQDATWVITKAQTSSAAFSAQVHSEAAPNTYAIKVDQLAQTHTIASDTVDNAFTALQITGTFAIDNIAVEIFADDSLRDIVRSINAVNKATAISQELPGHISAGGTFVFYGRETTIAAGSSLLDIRNTLNAEPLSGVSAAVVENRLYVAMDDSTPVAMGDVLGSVLNDLGLMDLGSRSKKPLGADIKAVIENNQRILLSREVSIEPINLERENKVWQDLGFINKRHEFAHELNTPKESKITVDGVAHTAQSNTVINALPGVTLSLEDISSYAQQLSVTATTDRAFSAIENFVSQYNNAMDVLNDAAAYGGHFFMDQDVWEIRDKLISNLTKPIEGVPDTINEVAEIGIKIAEKSVESVVDLKVIPPITKDMEVHAEPSWGYENDGALQLLNDMGVMYDKELGKLSLDADRLAKTLKTGAADVQALFSYSQDNFARRIADQASTLINSASGTIQKEMQVIENIRDSVSSGGAERMQQIYDAQREEYLDLLTIKQVMDEQSIFFTEKIGFF